MNISTVRDRYKNDNRPIYHAATIGPSEEMLRPACPSETIHPGDICVVGAALRSERIDLPADAPSPEIPKLGAPPVEEVDPTKPSITVHREDVFLRIPHDEGAHFMSLSLAKAVLKFHADIQAFVEA